MKKQWLANACILLVLGGCASSTILTGSWKSPTSESVKYDKILVAVLTNNMVMKSTVEEHLANALKSKTSALKAIDEFPPTISNSENDKNLILKKVKNSSIDGILTVTIISKKTETRFVPGNGAYNPSMRNPYYNSFWDYYSYGYPYYTDPGYYVQEKVYFMETNLYAANSGKLIWSAQTKTYDIDNLSSFSKEVSGVIVSRMKRDGLLK